MPIQEENQQTVPFNADDTSDVLQVPEQPADIADEAGVPELFSTLMESKPSAGNWGDLENPCDLPATSTLPAMFSDDEDGCLAPVPEELKQLPKAGVRFTRVPESCWKLDESNTKLYKDKSVFFFVDTVCTSQDILFGFDKAGFHTDWITLIQRCNSNSSWVVSFSTFEQKECALELNSITVCGLEVFLGDAQFCTVLVKIYECP